LTHIWGGCEFLRLLYEAVTVIPPLVTDPAPRLRTQWLSKMASSMGKSIISHQFVLGYHGVACGKTQFTSVSEQQAGWVLFSTQGAAGV
jgi:hypothetical protein